MKPPNRSTRAPAHASHHPASLLEPHHAACSATPHNPRA